MEEAIRILVVDDEPDIRRICRILLETGGYTVLEAATGAEAVEQVRQHPELDLILMTRAAASGRIPQPRSCF